MKKSGELSDAAFALLVERWWLKPDTLGAFAIDLYGRFKDDIIIVARNLTKHFVWCMKHRSKYCKIKVEEISDMLSNFWKSECGEMDLDSSQAPSSSQQACGNRWEQTVLMHPTATRRGPLRASSCPVRCWEILPFSRKPNWS